MEYYNRIFVAYATPKTFAEIPFSFAYWGKPELADIFEGFLAYYSSRARIRHATAIGTKRSTSPG